MQVHNLFSLCSHPLLQLKFGFALLLHQRSFSSRYKTNCASLMYKCVMHSNDELLAVTVLESESPAFVQLILSASININAIAL